MSTCTRTPGQTPPSRPPKPGATLLESLGNLLLALAAEERAAGLSPEFQQRRAAETTETLDGLRVAIEQRHTLRLRRGQDGGR